MSIINQQNKMASIGGNAVVLPIKGDCSSSQPRPVEASSLEYIMIGKTSKQRLARKAELANKPATPDKPLVPWMRTIDGNIEWLEVQIAISKLPGHAPRRMIEETINGVKTGRVSLARGI